MGMKGLTNVWVYVEGRAPANEALAAAVEATQRGGGTLTLVGAIGRSEDQVFRTYFGRKVQGMVREEREARLRSLGARQQGLPHGQTHAPAAQELRPG